jgi:hypothetical protein
MSWLVGRPTVILGEVIGDSRVSVDLRDMTFLQVAMHNSSGCICFLSSLWRKRGCRTELQARRADRRVAFDRVGLFGEEGMRETR